MPLPAFAASSSDRALAGVCGGIASALGVDVTLVRLVFALLALAGGAGIVLYLALWLYADGRPVWLAGLGARPLRVAAAARCRALRSRRGGDRAGRGRPRGRVAPRRGSPTRRAALVRGLRARRRRRGDPARRRRGRPGAAPRARGGRGRAPPHRRAVALAAGARAGRGARRADPRRGACRRRRARPRLGAADPRADPAPRGRAASGWRHSRAGRSASSAAGSTPTGRSATTATSVVAALSTVAADVEDVFGVRIELASSGDAPTDGAIVLAAREAMTNAAKFAGVEEIDVYVEVAETRDRGLRPRPRRRVRPLPPSRADRRGITESIEGRLERARRLRGRRLDAGRRHRGRAARPLRGAS